MHRWIVVLVVVAAMLGPLAHAHKGADSYKECLKQCQFPAACFQSCDQSVGTPQ